MRLNKFNIIFLALVLIPALKLFSQDLEPRYMSAVPTGGNFAVLSYGYSGGNILLDNTLPIKDLDATLNSVVVAYARSFRLFNKLMKFDIVAPYSFGRFKGVVSDIDSSTYRNGFGDGLIRLSVLLVGEKPVQPGEFANREHSKFSLGATARVRLPIGQYSPEKFLNLGANRWALKIGTAASYTIKKKLVLEGHFSSWFFEKNKDFYNGNLIEQKPLLSVQMHIVWLFKPGIWAAVSVGRSFLGETIINDVEQDDLKNSSRLGAVFAYRLNRSSALKIGVTSGLSTRYGADFTSLLIAYQFMWFDKK